MDQFDQFHGFNRDIASLSWSDFESNPSPSATPISDPYQQPNQNTQEMPQQYQYSWSMPQELPMMPMTAQKQNFSPLSVASWNQSANFDLQPYSSHPIATPSMASNSTASSLSSNSPNPSSSSAQFSPEYPIHHSLSHSTFSDNTASTSGSFDATTSSWSSLEDSVLPAGVPDPMHQPIAAQGSVCPYVSPTKMTRAVMEAFYADPEKYKCTIVIKNPTFIKKSYNKELRYLTPFPVVSIMGRGWSINKFMPGYGEHPSIMEVSMGFGNKDNLSEMDLIAGTIVNRHFRSKPLSTDETSTTTNLTTKLRIAKDYDFGTMTSTPINAPSKPSKSQKSTAENVDVFCDCHFIANGSTIGVFNRFKKANSDPGLLLGSENGKIAVDDGMWSVFQIAVFQSYDQKHDSNIVIKKDGVEINVVDKDFVQYGDTVILVDTETSVSLAPAVIRKVEHFNSKYVVSLESGETVSQQDYVAFEFTTDTGPSYLLSKNNGLSVYVSDTKVSGLSCLTEFAKWTIVGAEVTENTFSPLLQTPIKPIAPFPEVRAIITQDDVFFEVVLVDFGESFTVWIGFLQAPNAQFIYVDHMTRIRASFPPPEEYRLYQQNELVRISLVRDDGVLYMTDFYFSYYYSSEARHDKIKIVHISEIEDRY